MEQPGHAFGDMYSASSLYARNANGKGVPGQALMWITLITMPATTTSATWKGCAIAAIPARLAEIIPGSIREKITRTKSPRTVRLPKRTRPQLKIPNYGK